MLILGATKKSRIACCSACGEGKPCCSGDQKFEKRGALWLPQKSLPAKRVRRLRVPLRALLGQPSLLEWPGGRFWPGSPLLSVQFDMTCTGCCCSCDNLPDTLTATVTATTGGCGPRLGETATLTEAALGTTTDNQWQGTFSGLLGVATFACGNAVGDCGALDLETSLSLAGASCPITSTNPVRNCFDCPEPFSDTYTFTISPSSTCCGFGVGGTVTIEVSE